MSTYPPYYHTRRRAEAYGQYAVYADDASRSAEWARVYRDMGRLEDATAFQRLSAKSAKRARYYRAFYIAQDRLVKGGQS